MKSGEVAKNVTRGAFFLGLERGIGSLSTIVYSALIARWLGPGQFGMFNLAFSVVTLASALAGNADIYLERYAAEYQVRDRLRTLSSAFGFALAFKLVLGGLACAALLVMAPRVSAFYHFPELGMLIPLLSALVVMDAFSSTGRALLFGLQRYEWVSGLSLIYNIGRSLLAVTLWVTQHGVRALAIGLSVLTIVQGMTIWIAALFVLSRLRRERAPDAGPEPAVEPGLPRQMVAYCAPLYGANLSFLSGQNIGKLVLGKVLTAAELGFFSFAFGAVERLVEVVYTLPRALLPSLTHMVAREDREKLEYVFAQSFRLVQVVAVLASVLLFVFAREIVFAMGGAMFQRAIPMLRILALVPIVRTAQQPLTMLFQASRRPGHVLILALVKLLTEVAGYFALLLPFGAAGACWANVGGAVASFVGAMMLSQAVLPAGGRERVSASLRSLVLVAPLELAALAADRWLGPAAALGARLALVALAVLGLFPLALIVRYDLEKLSSLPLPSEALGRLRDRMVGGAGRLIRVFEPRRAA